MTQDEAMEFAPIGTYPSTGIDVLIVGTGFGGLTAALELTRKGHNVRILERNKGPDMSGMYTIDRYPQLGCQTVYSCPPSPDTDCDHRRHVLHGPKRNPLSPPLARDEETLQRNLPPQRLD